MAVVYNIRGTNGSGKTTLARRFLPAPRSQGMVALTSYAAPTKKEPDRRLCVPGYLRATRRGTIGVVGSYETACGGLDTVPTFMLQQQAISDMIDLGADAVIAEGVLASTVYGSWAEFADIFRHAHSVSGHQFAFVYMTTSIELCLQRIKFRQEKAGKVREIKEDLVRDKARAIAATRLKALAWGHIVYDLPEVDPEVALSDIMVGLGDKYRAE